MDVVDSYFKAVNTEDWAMLPTLLLPDATVRAPGAPPLHGIEAALGFYHQLFATLEAHTDTPVRRITEGDTVVVELRTTGRAKQGGEFAFDAIDVFDLDHDRIRRLTIMYDSADVISQITASS
jgi:ketosteroid isomerase-like protein